MRTRGFTLIELVVTVAIVAVISVGAMPLAELAVQRSREQDLRVALREIRGAIDAYKAAADDGRIELEAGATGYPPALEVLVEGVVDARDPEGRHIYFLRRIPRDPFHPGASADPATQWGLRSYASPPDDPRPGDDVYDVRSLSTRAGLNGVPYREW
jgi:general secretion pathway protein G